MDIKVQQTQPIVHLVQLINTQILQVDHLFVQIVLLALTQRLQDYATPVRVDTLRLLVAIVQRVGSELILFKEFNVMHVQLVLLHPMLEWVHASHVELGFLQTTV
jgi:hypothetical protein